MHGLVVNRYTNSLKSTYKKMSFVNDDNNDDDDDDKKNQHNLAGTTWTKNTYPSFSLLSEIN